ncbi:PilZ domain-containing protein [Novosphingobium sp.]|uniref:PilZ domain-containing protein n=1 Tax=Novosphingobium sp. TaxID=1874826 RepID=UPI0025EAF3B6|nr:PilZ domain-containing protein [Novosphingobium sp.]
MAFALPARLFSAARPDPDANVAAASDTPRPELTGAEARSEERVPISAGAMLVAHQTALQPVTIADLSRHGCCLDGDCKALRPGQFISIKIGKIERLAAIVRWVDEDRAGVEFTRALQPQAFEYHMRELSLD